VSALSGRESGPEGVVPRDINQARLRALALVGAKARLEELKLEEAQLRADFPELVRASRQAVVVRRRRRKPMTAAQKKAVSERMSRYWAERRKKGR
jgi:hypothetical protein